MKKILFPLLSALCVLACDPDFLTKAPETKMVTGNFFSSESELALWTNAFYVNQLEGADDLGDMTADDHVTTGLSSIAKGNRTPSSEGMWTRTQWGYLRNINYFFENSSRCPDEAARRRYEGVAHFFRAKWYFDMVSRFGDVPYYDYVIGSADTLGMKKARDPRGYVMMKVLEDLDQAAAKLPDNNDIYQVNRLTALAFKSRVALFEGTFRKYFAGTAFVPEDKQTFDGKEISSDWFLRQAADAASQVIGRKKLYTGNTMGLATAATDASYRELFLLDDASPDETIFARRYNASLTIRHGLQFDYANGRHSATHRFVNHYLLKSGKPVSSVDGYDRMDYFTSFQNRDPRMAQSLHGPKYVALDEKTHETIDWGKRTWSGYRIIKHISNTDHENATTSTTAWMFIRYAEVLLNYAEAKAELGELTKEDVNKTIDPIRARVGMPAMGDVPTVIDPMMQEYYPNAKGSQLAAILEIRRERTVELFSEGFRMWDLLRWKEGKWLTPKPTGGFQGIYVPALGEYDLDRDGKNDVLFYSGTKPSTTVAAGNQIAIGTNFTLSGGDSGFLTYYASEDYTWNENRDYLYPVPYEQRKQTGLALTQNPGWDDGL